MPSEAMPGSPGIRCRWIKHRIGRLFQQKVAKETEVMMTYLSCGRESLHAIVKQAIDQADPIGLLDMGCPDDEYNPEIELRHD